MPDQETPDPYELPPEEGVEPPTDEQEAEAPEPEFLTVEQADTDPTVDVHEEE